METQLQFDCSNFSNIVYLPRFHMKRFSYIVFQQEIKVDILNLQQIFILYYIIFYT